MNIRVWFGLGYFQPFHNYVGCFLRRWVLLVTSFSESWTSFYIGLWPSIFWPKKNITWDWEWRIWRQRKELKQLYTRTKAWTQESSFPPCLLVHMEEDTERRGSPWWRFAFFVRTVLFSASKDEKIMWIYIKLKMDSNSSISLAFGLRSNSQPTSGQGVFRDYLYHS